MSAPKPRDTYHHGDLRQALVQAGLELARAGGPDAIVLREATRRAGVAPNAAYRHFANREALFDAVRAAALGALAQAIEQEMAAARSIAEAALRSRALLAAVGRGYLGFAQAETGWFRTAFAWGSHDVDVPPDAARTAGMGLNPFELLGYALDAMRDAGVLAAERRPGAEFLAWSSVHGMALLMIDGPLRHAPPEQRMALAGRLLAMVEAGI
ncbi:MAG: TetR/AcrR family transcriptional regulator [Comamonas sp.]